MVLKNVLFCTIWLVRGGRHNCSKSPIFKHNIFRVSQLYDTIMSALDNQLLKKKGSLGIRVLAGPSHGSLALKDSINDREQNCSPCVRQEDQNDIRDQLPMIPFEGTPSKASH